MGGARQTVSSIPRLFTSGAREGLLDVLVRGRERYEFGDRRSYQIDPPDGRQGLASIERDLAEGADIVMVKPALAYLDLIHAARRRFDAPLAAYNVSGEYAMVKAAAERGWMDEERAALEILTAIVRAGADFVITYHALDAAAWVGA